MVYLAALLLFFALSGACWFVALALYRSTVAGPDPAAAPGYRVAAALAVGAATLTTFVQYPTGYYFGLVGWAGAAFGFLDLPPGRAAVLFGYLAASSFVARLAIRGVLDMFGA